MNAMATLYLDFKKTFDKLGHKKLNEKLPAMGTAGGTLTLLESYITERYKKVEIGTTEPIAKKIFSGVHQGSVLGPQLFNLFINNLPERIMSSCYGYADDYKVVDTNSLTLQIDASRIWQRCFQNMMKMNRAKNKLVSIMMETNLQNGRNFF